MFYVELDQMISCIPKDTNTGILTDISISNDSKITFIQIYFFVANDDVVCLEDLQIENTIKLIKIMNKIKLETNKRKVEDIKKTFAMMGVDNTLRSLMVKLYQ